MKKIHKLASTFMFLVFASYANAAPVILDITFDDFPSETSFGIWADGADQSDIFAGEAYDVAASSPIGFGDGFVLPGDFLGEAPGPWQFVWDLSPNLYTFILLDSFGDGICCDFGLGEYSLTVDGTVIATGGVFGLEEVIEFEISDTSTPVSAPGILILFGLGIAALLANARRKS